VTFLALSKATTKHKTQALRAKGVPKACGVKGAAMVVTDKGLRTILTAMPGVNDVLAHQLLVRFKCVQGVLTAEENQLLALPSMKPDQAHRKCLCARGTFVCACHICVCMCVCACVCVVCVCVRANKRQYVVCMCERRLTVFVCRGVGGLRALTLEKQQSRL